MASAGLTENLRQPASTLHGKKREKRAVQQSISITCFCIVHLPERFLNSPHVLPETVVEMGRKFSEPFLFVDIGKCLFGVTKFQIAECPNPLPTKV